MGDIIVIGAGPAGVLAALRSADLGARTVLVARSEFWRHGGQRRTSSGTDFGACGPADPRSPASRGIWHSRRRAGIGLLPPACARARGGQRCVCAFLLTRAARLPGSDYPREGRRGALRRPAHHRDRARLAASGGKDHHLHWRREPKTPDPWL